MGSTTDAPIAVLRGGEWLLNAAEPEAVWTPERLTEEQRLVARTTEEFVVNEVLPQLDRLEQKDWTVARQLLLRCGELGLLSVDVPERNGGMQLDKVTSMIVSERMSRSASFASTFGAQANLTILPLSLFGTDAQKRKYLPQLMTGEIVGAYCLSEPGSGSDALGAKTSAARQTDGSFVLNGEKMWITNGGFADIFVVFAKVIDPRDPGDPGGGHFTAFIVERAFAGLTSGKEEHRWACTARRRRRSFFRMCECLPITCLERSAKATRSRSTCSISAVSSSARCAAAARKTQSASLRGTPPSANSSVSRARRSEPSSRSWAR